LAISRKHNHSEVRKLLERSLDNRLTPRDTGQYRVLYNIWLYVGNDTR